MLRVTLRHLCVLAFGLAGSLVLAQDFSADVVNAKGKEGIKKVYSTKDKARYDFEGQNQTMGPIAAIVDDTQHKFFLLFTERHMYMDSWPEMMQKPTIIQFWHVQDVNDACAQWKKLAEQIDTYKNWGSCTKMGPDTLNGRSTVKYEGADKKGEKNYIWVDTKLHCVIKMTGTASETIELTNIKEGSQPASLFEVPSGYTKFDMGAMMQRQ
jgi:hypothetical protein